MKIARLVNDSGQVFYAPLNQIIRFRQHTSYQTRIYFSDEHTEVITMKIDEFILLMESA